MANFDTSQIADFESMTTEQKLEALLKADIPESVDMSRFVAKEVFDKKASEAASLSKQLKDRMTDDEAKAAEKEKVLADMQAELESLRRDKTVANYTAQYIAMGYDKPLAEETAKALADGDMEKVFANGAKHKDALEQRIKEDLLNRTPKPGGASGGGEKKDSAVEKAKELARARHGGGKEYEDIMSKYRK